MIKEVKNVEQVKAMMKESTKGKLGQFNKAEYEEMVGAVLNDTDREVRVVKRRSDDGTVTVENVNVAKKFRNEFLKPLIMEFGVDAVEAAKIDTMDLKNVGGFYEAQSEVNYEYMKGGRKLDFLPKEDFQASMYLFDNEEEEKERRNPKTKESFNVKYGAHTTLKVKTKCPKNLKMKL